jgi:hypothetical protein
VALLLADPRVDPAASDDRALRWAAHFGHAEVARLLLADPRVDPAALDPRKFAAFRALPLVAEALAARRGASAASATKAPRRR